MPSKRRTTCSTTTIVGGDICFDEREQVRYENTGSFGHFVVGRYCPCLGARDKPLSAPSPVKRVL